jgi:drug/metabolite transporter (DMT)-like permease
MSDNLKYKIILGFAAIYLLWGSTYLAIKIGVETIPPFLLVGLRCLTASLLFFAWGKIVKASGPNTKQWMTASIAGILMIAGGTGFVTWAEKTVPSGLASLLVSMVPFWIVLFDWLRPSGTRPRNVTVLGLLIGFVGVTALINPTDIGGFAEIDYSGALLLVFATIFWAGGSIYSRYADMPESKIVSIGIQLFSGGLFVMIISLLKEDMMILDWSTISTDSILALIYLIIFGSAGYAAYVWLIQVVDPSKVATYAYVNPVIALFLGNFLVGEQISLWTISCSILILGAVIIIVTSKKDKEVGVDTVKIQHDKVEPCESIRC